MLHFYKYQALGNDYLVISPDKQQSPPCEEQIRWMCDRHYGIGSDGVLCGPLKTIEADFGLRIFNPDGSEAEKSGNGLRIFARYLWEFGFLETLQRSSPPMEDPQGRSNSGHTFSIETKGGIVQALVFPDTGDVQIQMGHVSFDSRDIPVSGQKRQVVDERMQILGRELRFCAATIGNPHCIVICDKVTPELATTLGPVIETDARFSNRTNVQFMQVLDAHTIKIEIWERGAGYTLASGSSSCAAAASAVKLGLCQSPVTVEMQGGKLSIEINSDFTVTMQGPAKYVFQGDCEELDC